MRIKISRMFLATLAFMIFATAFSVPFKALADLIWAPAHRIGPEVIDQQEEEWNGYDNYDGYFWTYHGFTWTETDIQNLRNSIARKSGSDLIYEFRRGWGPDQAGSNEHWDGAWARNEHRCWWFIVCIGYNEQVTYTEYITSLPLAGNHGLEEHDGWFTQVPNHFPIQAPPSWQFDMCDIMGTSRGGFQCDEEYEINSAPMDIEPHRFYFVALKFRTDREDGTAATDWHVSFAVEEDLFPIGYKPHHLCRTDSGNWNVEYDPHPTVHQNSYTQWENCVDSDGDGEVDSSDNCKTVANADQSDSDIPSGDGIGDACDPCPLDPDNDIDGDGICGDVDVFPSDPTNDLDGDGIAGSVDNCPDDANPDQQDFDGDGYGDVCDSDDDNDGFRDSIDAFPYNSSEWIDTDGDGTGDNADTDDDGDEYLDFMEVSIGTDPLDAGSIPSDNDGDYWPDAMDADDDNDGVNDMYDDYPYDSSEWADWDGDGIGDNADLDDDNDGVSDEDEIALGTDPRDPVLSPRDSDGDGQPDSIDSDDDNDGVSDTEDAFPLDASEWHDADGDGLGDTKDLDDDNDLYVDTIETELGTDPFDSSSKPADYDGDLLPDAYDPDDDNDGVPDVSDPFPLDPTECSDNDGDGIGDNADDDDDNDGMPDSWESLYGLNPLVVDALSDGDGDGFSNIDEYYGVTDPSNHSSFPPFCGSSTRFPCSSNSDCNIGGCSGQVCKHVGESIFTICDVRTCYSAGLYGLTCVCSDNQCQWR